jgi:polysaccharide export outer membrane protein
MRASDCCLVLFTSAVLGLAGCGAADAYVWVEDVPRTEIAADRKGDYVIGSGDLVAIRVYNQEALSTRARVRPDGKIAVPLAGEIEARGLHPSDLAKEIEARLKSFVVAPAVIVSVEEFRPIQISVVGEAARPGVFPLEPGSGVLAALASAGGMTEFADRERIFVLRKRAAQAPIRIRFTYAQLSTGASGATFALTDGDVVVLE